MGKLELKDQKFGMLTVIKQSEKKFANSRSILWDCSCECGNTTIVSGSNLKRGNTKSCGCVTKERIKNINSSHNLSNTNLYKTWKGIKTRCYNTKINHYERYGGRGIKVYEEWKNDFNSFYNWSMTNGYSDGLTIDRIDNNGNYGPNNCRWVDMKVQSNNTRTNRWVIYKEDTKTLAQWCEYLGLNNNMVSARLHRGWSIEKTFETPVKKI